jgi:F-type H+-transporting ATPase subunit epsilon
MNIIVLTPDKEIFQGSIKSVKVPGTQGEFQILNNHAPIVSSLEHGTITIVTEGVDYRYYDSESGKIEDTTVTNKSGATLTYQIEGGFIEVLNNEINLLVTGVK